LSVRRLAGLVVVASAPMAVGTRLVAIAVWPFLAKVGWLEWYGQSLLITTFYASGYTLLRGRLWTRRRQAAAADGDTAFLRRVPPRLGRDVLCLQMEDHYVRIHTDQGSDLVLMPLAKAMTELNGLEGLQVHRSWGVARRAVAGVVEDGRNLRLKLANGVEAPVARATWPSSRQRAGSPMSEPDGFGRLPVRQLSARTPPHGQDRLQDA